MTFSTSSLNGKSPKEIAKILDGLETNEVKALDKDFFASLSPEIIPFLKTTDVYDSEGNDDSEGYHYAVTTKWHSLLYRLGENAKYLSLDFISKMSFSNLVTLSHAAVNSLTTDQIHAISDSVFSAKFNETWLEVTSEGYRKNVPHYDKFFFGDIEDYSKFTDHQISLFKAAHWGYAQHNNPDAFSTLSESQIKSISNDAIHNSGKLKEPQDRDDTDTFGSMDFINALKEQTKYLTAEQVSYIRKDTFNRIDVDELKSINLSKLSAAFLGDLDSDTIAKFGKETIGYLSGESVNAIASKLADNAQYLTAEQLVEAIAALNRTGTSALTQEQLASIDPKSIGVILTSKVTKKMGANAKYLSAEQLSGITLDAFNDFSNEALNALSDLSMLSATVLSGLSADATKHLSAKAVATICAQVPASDISSEAMSALIKFSSKLEENISGLGVNILSRFSAKNLDGLNKEATAALTSSQISAIAPNWADLSTGDGNFLSQLKSNAAYLSPEIASKLSAKQLNEFNGTAVAALTKDFVAAIKSSAISSLNDKFLSHLDGNAAGLTKEQIGAMSKGQLDELSTLAASSLKDLSMMTADALNSLSHDQTLAISKSALRTITSDVIKQLGSKDDGLIDQLGDNASFSKEQVAALSAIQLDKMAPEAIGAIKDLSQVSATVLNGVNEATTNAFNAKALKTITVISALGSARDGFFDEIGSAIAGFSADLVSQISVKQWDQMSIEAINSVSDLSKASVATLDGISKTTTQNLSNAAISTITTQLIQAMSNSNKGFFAELGANAAGFTRDQYNALEAKDLACMSSVASTILYQNYGRA